MNDSRKPQVTNYNKGIHIDFGVVLFSIIAIYLIINGFIFFTKDKITYYEVVAGENAKDVNQTYTGLAIRDESVYFADNSGYIDYFARDNSRVSKNTVLYSLDETGDVTKALQEAAADGNSSLKDEDIKTLKGQISTYASSYNDTNFDDVYAFKSTLEGSVLQLLNNNALEKIKKNTGDTFFKIYSPEKTGIVNYFIDEFQEFDETKIDADCFDQSIHTKATLTSGELVEAGSPVYSIISDEKWYIYIPLTSDEAELYKDSTDVRLKLLKDDIEVNAAIEVITGKDNKSYGKLTLYKYMIRYASDRYIDLKILGNKITGLKVPKSSVVTKDFYVIPVEYASYGADSSEIMFWKYVTDENGIRKPVAINPNIFYADDEYYYVSMDEFEGNEVLQRDDSDQSFTIGKTVSLPGVFNINGGYSLFVQINILSDTNEYYIVESGTQYGLSVYDHIVLDGSKVKDNQVIFQ